MFRTFGEDLDLVASEWNVTFTLTLILTELPPGTGWISNHDRYADYIGTLLGSREWGHDFARGLCLLSIYYHTVI